MLMETTQVENQKAAEASIVFDALSLPDFKRQAIKDDACNCGAGSLVRKINRDVDGNNAS